MADIWLLVDGVSVGHKRSRLGTTGWGHNDPDFDAIVLSLLLHSETQRMSMSEHRKYYNESSICVLLTEEYILYL